MKSIIPKYTFLLPAYKGHFLDEMLRSILSQTYTDFKVIISDDCSPEDLYGICKPYLDDSRFSYRRNEKNIGGEDLVAHWNLLVKMCETDYLIMASDDDVYDPTFLEEIDKLILKYPNVDLFHARARIINSEGDLVMNDALYEEFVTQLQYLAFHGYTYHVECVANYVYKTSKLKSKGGFVNFPLAWGSDSATNNLMAENGVVTTRDILFSFRYSGLNISTLGRESKMLTEKKFEASFQYALFLENLWKKMQIDGSEFQKNILLQAQACQDRICIFSLTCFHVALPFYKMVSFIRPLMRIGVLKGKYEVYVYIKKWFYYKTHFN